MDGVVKIPIVMSNTMPPRDPNDDEDEEDFEDEDEDEDDRHDEPAVIREPDDSGARPTRHTLRGDHGRKERHG